MQQKNTEQQQVIFPVNKEIQPSNPQKLGKISEEKSLKQRSEKIQAWKSDCPENLLNYTQGNGLVNTVHLAYDQHYNLELSPDDIWLAILQGFSSHLELNHEKLRKQFVDFEGKKELWIDRDHFVWGSNQNDWAGCFAEWCGQIQENIGDKNYENLIPDFTSSTQISQACFNATLMDSMKHYFSFGCRTCCGIPNIRLTGSLEDWQKLRDRAQNLGQYDLEWWTQILVPILDKFIESYQGKVDEIFWNCIYKIVPKGGGSGAVTTVTGWILNFFPYIKGGNNGKTRNNYLKSLEDIYQNYSDLEEQKKPKKVDNSSEDQYLERRMYKRVRGIMEHGLVLGGMTETPFKWKYYNKEIEMNIIAGFHNVCYDGDFIKPAKGWAIAEKQQQKTSEQQQQKKKFLGIF